ncbi:ATP-binding protein [Streptomyces sp. NBC_01643]|uniref:ATP-binding protein n=1 Tax=Streptomyces sp. NBC_01643 TaxID=2975906 RepID=UPI002F91591A|nr:ATP-binding protein [Streptomyces sp. NBC_01643]
MTSLNTSASLIHLPRVAPVSWEMLPDDRAPARLRVWVMAQLSHHQLQCLGDDLALIASELAANALRHGGTPAHVSMVIAEQDDGTTRVRMEVVDGGPGFDADQVTHSWEASEFVDQCSGRGLFIVAELSHSWGSRRLNPGQLVWAELSTD